MKLIFIHGRGQGGEKAHKLKEKWIETFKKGLAKSGLELPINESDIILPFYGKRLDDLTDQLDEPIEDVIAKGGFKTQEDAAFFLDFLTELSHNNEIDISQIDTENEITEKGPLNWEWIQAILRAIDNKTKWGEDVLKKYTYDVFIYLTNPNIKRIINNIIQEELSEEPCVFVGHSLGSVVGYNVLRSLETKNVIKYITIGSPLGLNAIKRYLQVPIQMPNCVKKGWFNAYDDRDVVALNPLDKDYFNIEPAIENKKDIDNNTYNRHGITGYLNDKTIAKNIYDALTET